jgi:hypothetical protein
MHAVTSFGGNLRNQLARLAHPQNQYPHGVPFYACPFN